MIKTTKNFGANRCTIFDFSYKK